MMYTCLHAAFYITGNRTLGPQYIQCMQWYQTAVQKSYRFLTPYRTVQQQALEHVIQLQNKQGL